MGSPFGTLFDDLARAVRTLGRSPGYFWSAVVSLALGLALAASTVAVFNAYLVRAMPFPASERLYRVTYSALRQPEPRGLEKIDWKALGEVVEVADYSQSVRLYLKHDGVLHEVRGLGVAPGALEALSVRAAVGRSFAAEEFLPGGEAVALIGHAFWQQRFGGDPAMVGREIWITPANSGETPRALRVIGILPPDFRYVREYAREPAEIVLPQRTPQQVYMVRLRAGVPPAYAETRIDEATRRVATEIPPGWPGAKLDSVQEHYARSLQPLLFGVTAAAGLVLLIATLNVAVLTLLRALRRQKEMAVRAALGAGRRHFARMLLAETAIVTGAAFVGGLALTVLALPVLGPLVESRLGRAVPGGVEALRVDFTVLAIAAGAGVMIALSLAFMPLLAGWQRRLGDALRSGAASGTDRPAMRRMRASLVALEVAGSLALLIGCGLMVRTVVNLTQTQLGFQTEHIVRARIQLPSRTYPDEASFLRFFDRLREELAALSATPSAFSTFVPFWEPPPQRIEVAAASADAGASEVRASVLRASEDYFTVFGIGLVRGRGVAKTDRLGSEPVALVSESLARALWPDREALGQRLRVRESEGGDPSLGPWRTIVGVVRDVRQTHTDQALHDVYLPYAQSASRFTTLLLRTNRPSEFWEPKLQAAVAAIEPDALLRLGLPLSAEVAGQLAGPRFVTALFAMFASFAVVLVALGIYGVTAYSVQQRQREIAIRIAIGAEPQAVVRMFLCASGLLIGAGLVAGLATAAVLGRLLANQLYGVDSFDSGTLAGAFGLMLSIGLGATWWAARRAALANPMTLLKAE